MRSAKYNKDETIIEIVLDSGKTVFMPTGSKNPYSQMLDEWQMQGNTIAPFMTDAEALADVMRKTEIVFIATIEKMIQAEVERLNQAKGVSYKDKYSCKNYGDTQGYIYQSECKALWDWSVLELYEPMRLWQQTLSGIPTEEEFFIELHSHTFTATY